jgi:hypothetical protein
MDSWTGKFLKSLIGPWRKLPPGARHLVDTAGQCESRHITEAHMSADLKSGRNQGLASPIAPLTIVLP